MVGFCFLFPPLWFCSLLYCRLQLTQSPTFPTSIHRRQSTVDTDHRCSPSSPSSIIVVDIPRQRLRSCRSRLGGVFTLCQGWRWRNTLSTQYTLLHRLLTTMTTRPANSKNSPSLLYDIYNPSKNRTWIVKGSRGIEFRGWSSR